MDRTQGYAPFDILALPHTVTTADVASLGKYRCAPATLTTFHAATASDNDMDTIGSPNRMFFPPSCSWPLHSCSWVPMRRNLSPTSGCFGISLESKKKEARMVRHASDKVAETCMSEP